MDAVGALSFLLIAVAALAALGGYTVGAVRQRNKGRVRGYFALGVVTGYVGAAVARRRRGRTALRTLVRRVLAQRFDTPLAAAPLRLWRNWHRGEQPIAKNSAFIRLWRNDLLESGRRIDMNTMVD